MSEQAYQSTLILLQNHDALMATVWKDCDEADVTKHIKALYAAAGKQPPFHVRGSPCHLRRADVYARALRSKLGTPRCTSESDSASDDCETEQAMELSSAATDALQAQMLAERVGATPTLLSRRQYNRFLAKVVEVRARIEHVTVRCEEEHPNLKTKPSWRQERVTWPARVPVLAAYSVTPEDCLWLADIYRFSSSIIHRAFLDYMGDQAWLKDTTRRVYKLLGAPAM